MKNALIKKNEKPINECLRLLLENYLITNLYFIVIIFTIQFLKLSGF